jgi:hypothetical protein
MARVVCEHKKLFLNGGTTSKDMVRYGSPCVECGGDARSCHQCSKCCIASSADKSWAREDWGKKRKKVLAR